MSIDPDGLRTLGGAIIALAIFVLMTMPRGRSKTPFE